MSNEAASNPNEQLVQTASPASSTQSETRRDAPALNAQFAARSGEEFTLSSLENPALQPVSEGKRFIDAPVNAKQPPASGVLNAPFSLVSPAIQIDDLTDLPRGASVQYREKYAAVMREFRGGKLQAIVKDRSVAIAIAAERATRIEAGPQQKQASSNDQKQGR